VSGRTFRITGFDHLSDVMTELRQNPGTNTFINGGTDFIIQIAKKRHNCVIDLSRVKDLKYIKKEDGLLKIGAGTTFAEIAASQVVRETAEALAQAAGQVGSVQIRNRATIGGNVASASPAGDSLPVLAAFDACIVVRGPAETRTIPVMEAIAGVGKSSLKEKELITEILLPLTSNRQSSFKKIGSRSAVTIARISMAMVVDWDVYTNTILTGKIALGSLGAGPICPAKAQNFMAGRKVDREMAAGLAGILSETVNEAIPDRESRPYKAEAVKGLTFDMVNSLFGTCFE
jgi:xanthine dehydrogenase FAD-binding subunit